MLYWYLVRQKNEELQAKKPDHAGELFTQKNKLHDRAKNAPHGCRGETVRHRETHLTKEKYVFLTNTYKGKILVNRAAKGNKIIIFFVSGEILKIFEISANINTQIYNFMPKAYPRRG